MTENYTVVRKSDTWYKCFGPLVTDHFRIERRGVCYFIVHHEYIPGWRPSERLFDVSHLQTEQQRNSCLEEKANAVARDRETRYRARYSQ